MRDVIGLCAVLVFVLVAAGTTGCDSIPGKATGGGSIDSAADEEGRANFGFNLNSCNSEDPENPTGRVTYRDKLEGVMFNGEVVSAGECISSNNDKCSPCFESFDMTESNQPFYGAEVEYRSTNPDPTMAGVGTAYVCAQDNGEGANQMNPDRIAIGIKNGPFGVANYNGPGDFGYLNAVKHLRGNIQAHPCDNKERTKGKR